MTFNETRKSLLGLMPKYSLECNISTPDAHTFGIQFARVTTKLLEWHDQRGSGAKALVFNITSNPLTFEKVKKLINDLKQQSGPYDFVSKLKISVKLSNQHHELMEDYSV